MNLLSRTHSSSSSTHSQSSNSGQPRRSWHLSFLKRSRSTKAQATQGEPESPPMTRTARYPDHIDPSAYLQVPGSFQMPQYCAVSVPSSPVPSLSYTTPSPLSPSPFISALPSPALSQLDLTTPAPASPYNRPSSALGLTDDSYHTIDFDDPCEPISSEQFYGSLLRPDDKPSEILKRMADALFLYVDSHCEDARFRSSGWIEPSKYSWLMHKMSEKNADVITQNIQSYYEAGRIPYIFRTVWGDKSLPCLDRRAWLHLVVFKIRAGPDEAYKSWTNVLGHLELQDPLTHQPFPKPFPRTALPTNANRTVHDEYDSWRGKIARKVQAPMQEAQRMQRQQAVNAMFAQLGTTDPQAQWMNPSPYMMGQTPYNPMAVMGMGYPNPAMANMWNRGGMGAGPMPGQFARQQSSQQGQRDLGSSGDSGGGTMEAFFNVTAAALNLASAEVGGGGGGDGGNGPNGNGNAANGAGPDWGVNFGPSGGGPGYNDGFGNSGGYGPGFNGGPGFGNGFGGPGFPANGGFGNASGFY